MDLLKYDEEIANASLGVFDEALFVATRDTKVNIFTTIIGFIVGIFTGNMFFSTSEPETGSLSVVDDGIIFLTTSKREITGHFYFSFDEIKKVIVGRSIIFLKQYTFVIPESGLRVSIIPRPNERKLLGKLKKRLDARNIAIQKSKKGRIFAAVFAAIIAFILIALMFETNSGPSAPEFGYTYEITFPDIYFAESMRGDVIMIYYDYVALTQHSANRPFTRNFVVYQGDIQLEYSSSLLPGAYRTFLVTHTFEEGEVFQAAIAVFPVDSSQTIRIVKYDEDEILFSQEFSVRT